MTEHRSPAERAALEEAWARHVELEALMQPGGHDDDPLDVGERDGRPKPYRTPPNRSKTPMTHDNPDHTPDDVVVQAAVDQIRAADEAAQKAFDTAAIVERSRPAAESPAFTAVVDEMASRLAKSGVVLCDHLKPGDQIFWPSWSKRWLCGSCAQASAEPIRTADHLRCDGCGRTRLVDDVTIVQGLSRAVITDDPTRVRPAVVMAARICDQCRSIDPNQDGTLAS